MSKYSVIMMIAVLSAYSNASFAEGNPVQLSKMEQAVLNVGQSCQGVVVDQRKFDLEMASGGSSKQAKEAAAEKQFNKKTFDIGMAAGLSNDDAVELATTYKYSDNSKFCVKLRALVRAEWEKSIAK